MMITQSMIKELRVKTGAGIMNCRNTLKETDGDMEKAVAVLKEKGLALAAQKGERVTAEGLISCCLSRDHKAGAMIELNCETDFVALNEEFITVADTLAGQAVASQAQTLTDFTAEKYRGQDGTVREALAALIAKLRENIILRRFTVLRTETGFICSYLHGGRIGVLLELACAKNVPALSDTAKELAMQIAAAKPIFVTKDDADPQFLANQSETYKIEAIDAGKPETLAAKIAAGKIAKFIKEKCLLEQVWIKNEDLTISAYLQEESRKIGAEIKIIRFARFEKGEGLAKREESPAQAVRGKVYGI
jgi:elongation factor Ts